MKTLKYSLALSLCLLTACPRDIEPPIGPSSAPVQPTPTPFSPSPEPSLAIGNPMPSVPPLEVQELANGDLISDSFKLEFGPGSKGVKMEFGPGTKGPRLEFGPGTKGPKNLLFDVNFPELLLNPDVEPFSVQQLAIGGLLLQELTLEIVRDNQVYATAKALPRRSDFQVAARFHPGLYSVAVVAETSTGPLQMSWNQIEILTDFNAELKVSVFGEQTARPEDLDIEVLSRNRIVREDSPDP